MDNVLIKLITDAGWKSVNERPPKGSAVEILTLWGSDSVSLIQGTAEYKNGSYFAGEQLLDTPSFWREVNYCERRIMAEQERDHCALFLLSHFDK